MLCHIHFIEKQLDTTNLKQIISALKNSKYEVGTWHSLCLSLGLLEGTLKTIEADENDSDDRLRTCLNKWLQRVDSVDDAGGPTWTSLEKALSNIDQKAVAESKCCHFTILYSVIWYTFPSIGLKKIDTHATFSY